MKEKSNKSNEPKQMRCKYCGHIQPVSQSFCEECGHDMALYGEIIRGSDEELPKPVLPKWLLPGATLLCVVCVIAVLICFVVPASEDGREPAQTSTVMDAMTIPETPAPKESTSPMADTISTEAPVYTEVTVSTESPKPVTEEAVLPDFLTFANGFVHEGKRETFEQRYSYSYLAASDAVRPVFDEYRTLLESSYPYQQIGTCEAVKDEWQFTYYWYAYTGPSEVTELTIGQIKDCNVWVVFVKNVRRGTAQIFVGGANEVAYRDNKERTTFQTDNGGPLQVTGITLDCFDLLYDIHDGSQADWVPQGYTIGYDLSVAYIGEKISEFDCQVTSSDENVLQVDKENFQLHAIAPGTAIITASYAGFSDSREITVYPVNEAAGSSLRVSTPVIEVSGTDPMDVPVTVTMTFGPDVHVMSVRYLVDKGVTDHKVVSDWVREDTYVYSMDLIFTVDPKALSEKTDKGILAYMLCKDGDDTYNLERDIMGYTVISIVRTDG